MITDFKDLAWLGKYMDGSDHIDVKVGEGQLSLREFLAAFLSYEPAWMRVLWHVRVFLLKMLGQGEHDAPESKEFKADTFPMIPGESAGFFEVMESDDETYWVAACEESHLGGALGVIAKPVSPGSATKRFQFITVVRYRNWAGPIYFNVIRLFHHIVVNAAMRSALTVDGAVHK